MIRQIFEPVLFQRLKNAGKVLLAGAGGGFDVYAALPIAVALADSGVEVAFANLSFAALDTLDRDAWLDVNLAVIGPDTYCGLDGYFPERSLARWLGRNGLPAIVYAFPRTGVLPLRAAYQRLITHLGAAAVVIVDGGTDMLLRGDESDLGTPQEDMATLAAVAGITGPVKLAASVGFGIDAYHGVNHALVLENIAAMTIDGSYLGAFSIPRHSRPGELYLDAVDHAQAETPTWPSIVQGQIAAALRGKFGNIELSDRTRGSTLFVNPLMGLYFTFDLDGLAARNLYLAQIENTIDFRQVTVAIDRFRSSLPTTRRPQAIPH
jgi:hypothetical protein